MDITRLKKNNESIKKRYSGSGHKKSSKKKGKKKLIYILYVINQENVSDDMLSFIGMSTDLTNIHDMSNKIADWCHLPLNNELSKEEAEEKRKEMIDIINDSIYIDTIVMNTHNPKHNLIKWKPTGVYSEDRVISSSLELFTGTQEILFFTRHLDKFNSGLIKNVYDFDIFQEMLRNVGVIDDNEFFHFAKVFSEDYFPNKKKREIEGFLDLVNRWGMKRFE